MVQYDTVDNDAINHPSHYAEGRKYEPIDVIVDWELGYLDGQVVKYLSRLGRKGSALEDARKAQFYMNRLVEEIEKENADLAAGIDSITSHRIAPEAVNIQLDGTDLDPEVLRVIFGDDFPVWP